MESEKTIKKVNDLTHKMNSKQEELIKIFEEIKVAKNDNEYLIPTYLEYEKYIKNLIEKKKSQLEQIDKILNYLHKNLLNSKDSTEKYNLKISKKKSELTKNYILNENERLKKCILNN